MDWNKLKNTNLQKLKKKNFNLKTYLMNKVFRVYKLHVTFQYTSCLRINPDTQEYGCSSLVVVFSTDKL